MLAAIFETLPIVLGLALLAILLYGFWQGLSLRPHGPGHRPPSASKYFWWAQNQGRD